MHFSSHALSCRAPKLGDFVVIGLRMTHFVPVTLCVTQETRRNRRPYGVTHNVTGTKCVTKSVILSVDPQNNL